MTKYFIRIKVGGKIKYWDQYHGLHSGRSSSFGYQVFTTKMEAQNAVRKFKVLFSHWFKFEVLPASEIPFIKKQIKAKQLR